MSLKQRESAETHDEYSEVVQSTFLFAFSLTLILILLSKASGADLLGLWSFRLLLLLVAITGVLSFVLPTPTSEGTPIDRLRIRDRVPRSVARIAQAAILGFLFILLLSLALYLNAYTYLGNYMYFFVAAVSILIAVFASAVE